jgi:hypothetical protein
MALMALCSSVPWSAWLLLGLGGIFCTKATEPGQAITRLADEPPTMLLCCMYCPLVDEAFSVA